MRQRTQSAAAVSMLHVVGELDLDTVPSLQRDIEHALTARPQTLALDLSGCTFAGVDAVEMLVALTTRARRQGTTLVLFGLRPVVVRVISLLGLEQRLFFGQSPHPRPAREVPR